ncbi:MULTISPECIES: four helix bundle protein [Thermodesulfovibrio]|uniref:Four helix bundle protein n=1 Tax=Thermodesulfovibrio yellowstonii TaxID=28262 RepID=A0A9W6LLS2_9BACT|nr:MULTISPECIES: four helix bundle protein [Thermodesulfovibrio]MDI6864406.1 four helix bundle protein [Thermodesulfovibrio yellowstonii]GLI54140.1 hypothetical protein TISLANDTSLP1_18330 [Thermodesulfovibrio islandicus]
MRVKTHKDLDIWKEGIEIVTTVYELTKTFPDFEKYGLTSQMQRAAVSIPSNIAEGAARNSKKEFIQFIYVALGSLSELETLLIISKKLNYLSDERYKLINNKIVDLRKKMLNFLKYLREKCELK